MATERPDPHLRWQVAHPSRLGHTRSMHATPLRLELRTTLGALAGRWDELAALGSPGSPFLRSWWVDHAAGAAPVLVCCFEGAELVGGAAFEVDRIGRGPLGLDRVRCLGQGVLAPDHLDVVASPERRREVCDAVVGWLRRPGSRLLDLDGLAATGELAAALGPATTGGTAAPYAELPADGATYLAARPGQVRSTITRTRKRFAKQGVQFRRVPADGVAAALDTLAALHDGRWSDESEFLVAWDRCRTAALAGAATGDVVLHELRDDRDGTIAIELDLRCGDRLAFYQAGRRTEREWRGCGSVLRADLIDLACTEGVVEYDLLRGDESYKADWATARRELVRCREGVGPLGRGVDLGARANVRLAPLRQRLRDALAARADGRERSSGEA